MKKQSIYKQHLIEPAVCAGFFGRKAEKFEKIIKKIQKTCNQRVKKLIYIVEG